MPLYEYQCEECGRRLEVIQKFSDDPLTECKRCGGKLERLLSAPAIQFKGSGWYITDYARKSNGDKPAKEPAKEKPAESKPETGAAEPAKATKSSTKESGSTGATTT